MVKNYQHIYLRLKDLSLLKVDCWCSKIKNKSLNASIPGAQFVRHRHFPLHQSIIGITASG
jgi:hypothetical protein